MTYLPVHIRPNICYFFTVVNLGPFPSLYLNFAFVSLISAAEHPVYLYWFCRALNWIVARFLFRPRFRYQKLLLIDGIIVGSAISQTITVSVCCNRFVTLWYFVCSIFNNWSRTIALQTQTVLVIVGTFPARTTFVADYPVDDIYFNSG